MLDAAIPAIISYSQAKSQGLKRYFTGKPCRRGHVVERYAAGGHCLACAQERVRPCNDRSRELQTAWSQNNPTKTLVFWAKSRAKKRGLEFRLLPTDIIIPRNCPCCGRALRKGVGQPGAASPSLDRHDNNKGYTPENVEVICFRCNELKADASVDELTAVLNYMKRPH